MDQNSKPQHTRPFNVEHAKTGAPYACRDGSPATVFKWDAKGDPFALIGFTEHGGSEVPENWTANGLRTVRGEHPGDLVMLPLGYIEGKPVFVGDKIINCYGDKVSVPPHSRDFTNCRWPDPEKQYPVTGMTNAEIAKLWADTCNRGDDYQQVMRDFINAALRHAIDAGTVVTRDAHELAMVKLQCNANAAEIRAEVRSNSERAARDMAIAEAVREAVLSGFNAALNSGTSTFQVDLTAIIAKVPQ